MRQFTTLIIGALIIGAIIYINRGPLQVFVMRLENTYLPCRNPITYALGSFDTKFGISREYFLSALRDAETIWEKPAGRELFALEPEGEVKVNLIYDYRQQATATLEGLGITLGDTRASYDTLKQSYAVQQARYRDDKATFETEVSAYKARQNAYEKEVTSWNARGGAPKDVYDRLDTEKSGLNAEAGRLNQLQAHLNGEVDTINAMVVVLNRMATALNLDVAKINAVGETLGGEFEEGNYQRDGSGQHIDIYEFNTRAKLVRILAHELGHALGLAHVDDPEAIMYRLNSSKNGVPTKADIAALTELCRGSI